jgi:hypothetical protein
MATLDVQDAEVHFSVVTFESDTGRPVWYVSEGRLRDDAVTPGQSDPPAITNGYYPLHTFTGDLVRIEGGNCITCSTEPRDWRRTVVGRIGLFFPYVSGVLVDIVLDPQHVPTNGFRSEFLFLRRFPVGRPWVTIGNTNPSGPPSYVHHDLRGQWVFVDQADAGAPVRDDMVRYDFTEQVLSPQPFIGSSYSATYRDPARGAELRCTSVGTAIGQKAAGCELHSQGRVLFSARREDIGMDRIQAFRGELPTIVALIPTVTNPYRKPGQVIGLRVSMPPPGPLGPADAPPSGSAMFGTDGPAAAMPSRSFAPSGSGEQQR